MTEAEFRKKAKSLNYNEEDVEGMVKIVQDAKEEGWNLPFEHFQLIEQPNY